MGRIDRMTITMQVFSGDGEVGVQLTEAVCESIQLNKEFFINNWSFFSNVDEESSEIRESQDKLFLRDLLRIRC